MFLSDAFEVGTCYRTFNPIDCFLYVLRTVDQSVTRRAVYGVMFDLSYRIISKRWFRVSRKGGYTYAQGNNVTFCQSMIFSPKDACFPPDDVLDYFRQAPDGVCA